MQSKKLFVASHSSLNPFLYSEVATESTGTPLTILSVLARLGKDPWEEAKNLTRLPNAKAVDCLARDLLEMPVYNAKVCEAQAAASQAIIVLKSSFRAKPEASTGKVHLALIFCVLALGLLCNILLMTKVPAELLNENIIYLSGW